jgi:hypothetical protein
MRAIRTWLRACVVSSPAAVTECVVTPLSEAKAEIMRLRTWGAFLACLRSESWYGCCLLVPVRVDIQLSSRVSSGYWIPLVSCDYNIFQI